MTKISCPCNPNKLYSNCCEPFHVGKALPMTAEQLMRSRYSGYVLKLADYINKTWHPTTCPNILTMDDQGTYWMKLIINKAWDSKNPDEAFVDFDAFYEINGKLEKMQETSRFVKVDGKWLYIDGTVS